MLLLFLLLFLNVKMLAKVAAVIILLILNRKMFLERSIYQQRFIWFYCSMIVIASINLLLHISSASINYFIVVSAGIFFWLMCIVAAALNYWFVLKTDSRKLHITISLFFLLNAVVTIGQLLFIMWDAGSLNPYSYQGIYQKYFISTGDFLTGISFDVSNTNALINSFGVIYFLFRNKMKMVLFCMAVLLLTASNFTNILVTAGLLFVFIFKSTWNQKAAILTCFFLLIIFMVKISPQNNSYAANAYKKIFHKKNDSVSVKENAPSQKPVNSVLTKRKKEKSTILFSNGFKEAGTQEIQKKYSTVLSFSAVSFKKNLVASNAYIHTAFFQRRKDSTQAQKKLLAFGHQTSSSFDMTGRKIMESNLPGKVIAAQQTFHYLKNNPEKILFGKSTGTFSSKLAFRTTGLGIAGSYPQKLSYINKDFLSNHLNLYLVYFSKDMELHSVINSPDSVYDQIIAEYGLAGVVSFILLYIGFFVKNIKRFTYGIPLLLIMLGAFGIEYWFEQLSVVILFELLMLLNIKETKEQHE